MILSGPTFAGSPNLVEPACFLAASQSAVAGRETKDRPAFNHLREVMEDLFDKETHWPVFEDRLKLFINQYPHYVLAPRVRNYIATLDQMARLEKKHRANPGSQSALELVYQLRNHVGKFDLILTVPQYPIPNPQSPGDKLVAMGLKAVPALIDSVTDESLTHQSIDALSLSFGWKSRVVPAMRLGTVALRLLEGITFQNFEGNESDELEFTEGNWSLKMQRVKALAKRWWRDNQQKTQFEILSEAAVKGLPEPFSISDRQESACETLAHSYRSQARSVFQKALASIPDKPPYFQSRIRVIQAAGTLKDQLAALMLAHKMNNDKGFMVRLRAAQCLWPSYPSEVVASMKRAWEGQPAETDLEENCFVGFLNGTGEVAFAELIAKGLRNRPIIRRQAVLQAYRWGTGGDNPPGPKLVAVVERMLVSELDDKDVDTEFKIPMCDFAVEGLGALLPTKYPVDRFSSWKSKRLLVKKFKETFQRGVRPVAR